MEIRTASENALIIRFATDISPAALAQVRRAVLVIEREFKTIVVDMIPSYASLVVVFRPERISRQQFRRQLRQLLDNLHNLDNTELEPGKTHSLPVYYSRETGWDLAAMAERQGLSCDEIIHRHSDRGYLVYAIGFAPGFAYLGEVDASIATPRHGTPRKQVPKGAVAIADRQTAVYPTASPGGWNLIGNCPLPLFDTHDPESTRLFAVGDRVVFRPITAGEFRRLGGVL
jgi:KipI family sensor histidine kinase inhibitor